MSTSENSPSNKLPATPWGLLPPQLRVLLITSRPGTGRWLADALASDSAAETLLEEAFGIAAGAARLRAEVYDAVMVCHEPDELDALQVIDALRAGSSDEQPILILGQEMESQMAAFCFEAGADGYICLAHTTTRALLWQLARARERHALIQENRRLRHDHQHRLQMEHDEAARLLQQQHALVSDLEKIRGTKEPNSAEAWSLELTGSMNRASGFAEPLVHHYRELLRAYVIMGSGNLVEEMGRLAAMLTEAQISAQQVMQLHLRVLEEAVSGLGSRSARHVMNRADLLVLEVMLHLAEDYRKRLQQKAVETSQQDFRAA